VKLYARRKAVVHLSDSQQGAASLANSSYTYFSHSYVICADGGDAGVLRATGACLASS